MTWTNPDPWHCYQCGAEGLGGREAGDHHDRTAHAPKPKNPKPGGSVVPEGIASADVRAYGLATGEGFTSFRILPSATAAGSRRTSSTSTSPPSRPSPAASTVTTSANCATRASTSKP